MQTPPALRPSRAARLALAAMRYEPKLLRGLTRIHFAYAGLLAVAFSAGPILNVFQAGLPAVRGWTWIIQNVCSGVFILVIAAVLSNIDRPRLRRPIALAVAVTAGCVLALVVDLLLWSPLAVPIAWSGYRLRYTLTGWGLVVAAYYFMERSALRAAALRAAEVEHRRLETQMFEARLQVLRAQVEPHFLFNTLAHIQRFYQVDPVRGRAMLDSFCGYLRAALPHMRGESSTVAQEVGLARAYLEIQQLRMRGRLRFAIDVPRELNDVTLPPMMLVPLVENAIKHGVAPLPEGGAISISATMEARTLRMRVADTGAGFCRAGKTSGTGIGLSNTRSRLAALYGPTGSLTLAQNDPCGVVAELTVPYVISGVIAAQGEYAASAAAVASSPWAVAP
jgi:signal transduction histidine kinase